MLWQLRSKKVPLLIYILKIGSISTFNEKFDIKNDPENIEIDFVEARISDHSAIEAIFALVEKYSAEGKKIH